MALPDPIQDTGVFTNGELQSLYDSLLTQGSQSVLEALKVGALIEEVDIEDLQIAIAETENPALLQVYSNLLKGSENHLRAFVRQIEFLGETYNAQHFSQEIVDEILANTNNQGGSAK